MSAAPTTPPAAESGALGSERAARRGWTRFRRRLGTVLIVLGVLGFAYGASIYFWRDPVTDLWARYQQHKLVGQLEQTFNEFRGLVPAGAISAGPASEAPPAVQPEAPTSDPASERAALAAQVKRAAGRFYARIEPGQALGRIIVPRLGIDPIFVNGTEWGRDLSKGPGRYERAAVPGLGKVTAIAGHRTTFGAWFRHIDQMKPGDTITLKLPYGTFHYRVFDHKIVANDDWAIIDPRGFDELVLSACHPLYSASHRYVVFARLASVDLPGGRSYKLELPSQETRP
jgi:sortase A